MQILINIKSFINYEITSLIMLNIFIALRNAEEFSVYPEYRVISGDSVQLPCNITIPFHDDTITLVLWYRGDSSGAPIYTLDARQVPQEEESHFLSDDLMNRAFLNISVRPALLTIDPVRDDDGGEYRCRVDFRWGRTTNSIVNLNVIVPPRKVIIKDEKLEPLYELAGPYDEDTDVRLNCEAKGARPPAIVLWYRDNVLIDDTYTIVQENTVKRVRNELIITKIKRTDLHALFMCHAFNVNGTKPITGSVRLEINLKPLSVEIIGNKEPLNSGRKSDFLCQSKGSRPPAQLTWFKDKRILTYSRESISDGGNLTQSVITLIPEHNDDGTTLTCKAENVRLSNSSIEDSWLLSVLYEPKVSLTMKSNAKENSLMEGNEIIMECKSKANPPVNEYIWYFNDRMIRSDPIKGITINNQSFGIKRAYRWNSGKYYCVTTNIAGRGKSNDIVVNINYAPVCKSEQKIIYGLGIGETVKILCDIDARPNNVFFYWAFNQTQDPNLKYFSNGLRSILLHTPKDRHDFGYFSCWAKNVIGIQQVPCVYSVIPSGRPETMLQCVATNHKYDSFSIECIPGYDGGHHQMFLLEIYDKTKNLLLNITESETATFELRNLESGITFDMRIYSINSKGKSDPFILTTQTFTRPINSYENVEIEDVTPWIKYLIGVTTAFLLLILITFVLIFTMKRNNLKTEQSTYGRNDIKDTLKYGDISHNDSINPDIIPPGDYIQHFDYCHENSSREQFNEYLDNENIEEFYYSSHENIDDGMTHKLCRNFNRRINDIIDCDFPHQSPSAINVVSGDTYARNSSLSDYSNFNMNALSLSNKTYAAECQKRVPFRYTSTAV